MCYFDDDDDARPHSATIHMFDRCDIGSVECVCPMPIHSVRPAGYKLISKQACRYKAVIRRICRKIDLILDQQHCDVCLF